MWKGLHDASGSQANSSGRQAVENGFGKAGSFVSVNSLVIRTCLGSEAGGILVRLQTPRNRNFFMKPWFEYDCRNLVLVNGFPGPVANSASDTAHGFVDFALVSPGQTHHPKSASQLGQTKLNREFPEMTSL